MSRSRTDDTRQLSLDALFFEAPPTPQSTAGGCDVALAVREALNETISCARRDGTDRYEIASRISRYSGRDMTKATLDRYCAPSAEDWRFPMEALPALIAATGDYRLLDLVAEACGCRVLRGEEAWLAEFGALLVQQREVNERLASYKKHIPGDVLKRLETDAAKRVGGGVS